MRKLRPSRFSELIVTFILRRSLSGYISYFCNELLLPFTQKWGARLIYERQISFYNM